MQNVSTLGDIATAALKGPASLLGPNGGTSLLSINSGEEWLGTKAEAQHGRDYIDGGQQAEIRQTFVGSSEEFLEIYSSNPREYIGQIATLDGESFRVAEVNVGEAFTEVVLEGEHEAP